MKQRKNLSIFAEPTEQLDMAAKTQVATRDSKPRFGEGKNLKWTFGLWSADSACVQCIQETLKSNTFFSGTSPLAEYTV